MVPGGHDVYIDQMLWSEMIGHGGGQYSRRQIITHSNDNFITRWAKGTG